MSSHRSLAGAAAGGWLWGVKEAKFWSPKSAEELYKRSLSPHSHRIATRGPSSHFALGHSSSQKKKKYIYTTIWESQVNFEEEMKL